MLLPYTTLTYYGPGAAAMVADPGVGDMVTAAPRQTQRFGITVVGTGDAPLLRPYRGYAADLDTSGGASQAITPHQKMAVKLQVNVGAVPSAADIAQAIWNANAATFNNANTMGNRVNAAGSGGVDLEALAQAVWEYATRTLTTSSSGATAAELRTELAPELARMDVAVSTRLAASGYTAPTAAPSAATVATTVWQQAIEAGFSAEELMRVMAAALAGTTSKVGSTITFKGVDGATDRIVGSFDAESNRTGAILDGR